jgi:hypothetical protein
MRPALRFAIFVLSLALLGPTSRRPRGLGRHNPLLGGPDRRRDRLGPESPAPVACREGALCYAPRHNF